nr:Hsp70-type chaperone [Meringosphaera mediterranea]WLD06226.1 Hsp70-type chaperone [Meringosphaera mediterranea]
MQKIIGIDLGTTNSVVAMLEDNEPLVIPNVEGFRTTPSIVAYTAEGEVLVGQPAKRQGLLNVENTFYSVKRFIGTNPNELNNEQKDVAYNLIPQGETFKIKASNLEKLISPEEVSGQVLRQLALDATDYIGNTVNDAVITVPAYFNDTQRQATKDAGRIAGLDVKRIINEPTAASLAYGLDKKSNEHILVFDLGGGTFDVSVLEVGDGVFEVLSTAGDTRLGGDTIDRDLVDFLLQQFEKKENKPLEKTKVILQRLTEAAEKAKIDLSTMSETTINLPFLCVQDGSPKHIEETITRELFEKISQPTFDSCLEPVKRALKDAGLTKDEIGEVVLVGGSTRIPGVQRLVKELTGRVPNQTVNPDEVVAIGAAIQGGVLSGEVKDVLLLDVTPLSLGLETMGSITTKLINRNTTVPTKKSEVFSTATDSQSLVEINVLQGERELAQDNKSLGSFRLSGIPEAPRGVPQIEVSFDIDANGILMVTAQDKTTGKEQSITIEGSSRLDESEIEKMIKDAETFAAADKERRELIELKNTAEVALADATQVIEVEDNNPAFSQDISEIKNLKTRLEEAINDDNAEKLKEILGSLREKLELLSTKKTNQENEESDEDKGNVIDV